MTDISQAAVRSLIADFFSPISECGITSMEEVKTKVVLVDDSYSTISRIELLSLAKECLLMAPPDVAKTQITDCDDYALLLKGKATAHFRQSYFAGSAEPVPPAVAIVISQNHAINLFIEQNGQGKKSIWFIDASAPDLQPINDPVQALQMMKLPPVKMIYM